MVFTAGNKNGAAERVKDESADTGSACGPSPSPRPRTQTHPSVGQSIELPHDDRSPFAAAGRADGSDQRKLLSAHVVVLCGRPVGIAEQDK